MRPLQLLHHAIGAGCLLPRLRRAGCAGDTNLCPFDINEARGHNSERSGYINNSFIRWCGVAGGCCEQLVLSRVQGLCRAHAAYVPYFILVTRCPYLALAHIIAVLVLTLGGYSRANTAMCLGISYDESMNNQVNIDWRTHRR